MRKLCTRTGLGPTVPQSPVAFAAFKGLGDGVLFGLERVVRERRVNPDPSSYTSKIVRNPKKIRKKVMEEALELVTARGKKNVIWEAADLLYFTVVYLVNRGVDISDVLGELMRRRAGEKGGKDGQRYAPMPE